MNLRPIVSTLSDYAKQFLWINTLALLGISAAVMTLALVMGSLYLLKETAVMLYGGVIEGSKLLYDGLSTLWSDFFSDEAPEIIQNVPQETWGASLSAFPKEGERSPLSTAFTPHYKKEIEGNTADVKDRVEHLQTPLYTDSSTAMDIRATPKAVNARPEGQPDPNQPGLVPKKNSSGSWCVIC